MAPAAVLVAILATSCLFVVEAKLPRKIALEGATYTLKSEFVNTHGTIQVDEFHSNQQQRSRVNYLLKGYPVIPDGFLDTEGSFFADTDQITEVSATNCRIVEQAAIWKALQSDMLDSREATSYHVIGTARFLAVIEKSSDKFQQVKVVDGVLGAQYYLARLDNYEVIVYYEADRVLPLGVPSGVRVTDKNIAKSFVVRLRTFNLMKPNELIFTSSSTSLSGLRQPSNSADELLFDVFAIDRARGCTRDSKSALGFLTNKHRFSFKAQLLAKKTRPVELVVGYEPELATLRVDHSYGAKWSQTLTNFRNNRRYNVMKRVTGGEVGRPHDDYFDIRQANDVSCVVTQAGLAGSPASDNDIAHPLDLMLNGATKLTYLGMARVRGIDAHVYEAYDSRLPVWLDLPSVYESQEGIQMLRDGRLPNDEHTSKLTTVLYFSQTLSTNTDNKLLLIEIFANSISSLNLHFKIYTIPIHEFSWDIRPTAPNGERWQDFYLLGEECLAPSSGDNHYARLNFSLEIAGPDDFDPTNTDSAWLQEPVKRNVALIKAIDKYFKIPSTLIYNLESLNKGYEVAVTLLMAERKSEPIAIKYLGRSRQASEDCQGSRVISFQNCLDLAAHRHEDTIFAYINAQSICMICRAISPPTDPNGASHIFPISPTGPYEVYQSVHRIDSEISREDQITKLDEARNCMLKESRRLLDNPNPDRIQLSLDFQVTSVEIEHLDEKVAYDLDEHHLADVNKFPGLGLVPDDPQNKLVEPKGVSEESITFEQCQEACLIDLECQAYSTCIVKGKIQCVLSSVDFKVPTTVIELMLLKDKKSKLGEVSKIKLSGGGEPEVSTQTVDLSSIHIKKHPTCELHNKLYRDVFKPAGLSRVDLKGRLLRPVAHPEECAEFCFLGTLATMRKEARRLHKTTHGKDDPGLTEGYSASHCGHYFYLDQQKLASSKMKIPAEQIIGVNTDGATRGYCVFDDGSLGDVPVSERTKKKKGSNSSLLSFELRKFELDFTLLYEKKYGVSLVSSAKKPDEIAAYDKLLTKSDYTSDQLELMRKFIQAGGNTARMEQAASAQECARACFTQSFRLWPACQSFEYIESIAKVTSMGMAVCVYNTLTLSELRQLGRTDLIRENNSQNYLLPHEGDEIRVWHYEPRHGLVASSVEQQYQISMDQSEFRLHELRRVASSRLSVNTFVLFLIICAIVVSSLGVGMKLSSNPRIEQILSQIGVADGHTRGYKDTLVDGVEGS